MSKRLVVLADGTWNDPAQKMMGVPCATNVVALARAVAPQDAKGTVQVVAYHDGVGARETLFDHLLGGAFGVGLSNIIQDLYLFLASNYANGDEVWFFGFSRGAYTVRSLAGLIRNSGLLRREYLSEYEAAYDLYRDRSPASHPRSEKAKEFRTRYSWPDFDIRFIGVWDTVGSLGIPLTKLQLLTKHRLEFHDTDLSSHVDRAYQALAIDEHRTTFSPTLWKKQDSSPSSQLLEQAWFPGDHCDVGGGHTDRRLADGPLEWMCKRAERAGLALDFTKKPAPDPTGIIHDMPFFFRWLGTEVRPIGVTNPAGNEYLSKLALDRIERVKGYTPENVAAFRKSQPGAVDPELKVAYELRELDAT